jgi:hypothetical protein
LDRTDIFDDFYFWPGNAGEQPDRRSGKRGFLLLGGAAAAVVAPAGFHLSRFARKNSGNVKTTLGNPIMTTNHPYLSEKDRPKAGGEALPLDDKETTVHRTTPNTYRVFLTSSCQKDILHGQKIYQAIDRRDDKNRAAVYDGCRVNSWFVRHRVTFEIRVASSRCKLRWCPLCIKTKTFVMQGTVGGWVKSIRNPKFMTFTLKHSEADLSFQINSLYDAFRTLRRRPWWRKKVRGGIWFFQIKRSDNDGLWHPHLHCLVDSNYIDKYELGAKWQEITHSSKVVDVKAVRNPKKVAQYVARYAAAPCRLVDLSEEDSIEIVDALHGRKICGTWGTGSKIKLTPQKPEDADMWERLADFWVVASTRHHNEWRAIIWECWVKDKECPCVPDPPPYTGGVVPLIIEEPPLTYDQLVFEWNTDLTRD